MPAETIRRTEAKAYFANERTFLHWMNVSVTIGSISAALSGVAGHAHRSWGDDYTSSALYVRVLSMFMLATSIMIAVWGGYNFNNRANMLTLKLDGPYDSKVLPAVLAVTLVASLMVVFSGAVMRLHSDS
ncbi:hypothetical protein OEZ85_004889 [Tetradesmus obliquus]|uniref:DUF202 domain-containing protein n=1 Tax=Tetradesmus obliquus TaxID=3088 RepID=A0ABY8UGK2_TETOB|nr:hypothetical protein OEZ85_004889 [Tetradesmus obliquus]